ncbi:MAG: hypothetical protein ACOZNI_06080 [Myxococcota bacterium]
MPVFPPTCEGGDVRGERGGAAAAFGLTGAFDASAETARFRVWYDPSTVGEADAVATGEALEAAWDGLVGALGWPAPPSAGLVPVVIGDLASALGSTTVESQGVRTLLLTLSARALRPGASTWKPILPSRGGLGDRGAVMERGPAEQGWPR